LHHDVLETLHPGHKSVRFPMLLLLRLLLLLLLLGLVK
jgi:hypothetical protein